jgi:hypothetical protein
MHRLFPGTLQFATNSLMLTMVAVTPLPDDAPQVMTLADVWANRLRAGCEIAPGNSSSIIVACAPDLVLRERVSISTVRNVLLIPADLGDALKPEPIVNIIAFLQQPPSAPQRGSGQ